MIKDYVTIALANVSHRRTRSFLTVIGIFIGIAAIVALISLGQGLSNAVTSQFESLGKDKITILSSVNNFGAGAAPAKALTSKDVDTVGKVRGIRMAAGILMKSAIAVSKEESKPLSVIGYPLDEKRRLFEDLGGYGIAQGRKLKQSDNRKIVIGSTVADGLYKHKLAPGDSIEINGLKYQIVGVFDKTGSPQDDKSIYMPYDTVKKDFSTGDDVYMIFAQTQPGYVPADVAESVRQRMRRQRNEKAGEETFSVSTSEQLLQTFNSIFGIVQAVVVGLAAISLVVGGIGIMNTMYTSVLERTKEIGLMKAVGARNGDIMLLFLIESGLLGLVGGLLGVATGYGLGKAVEIVAQKALNSNLLQAVLPIEVLAGALAFSIVIGTLSGALPALQASKLKPVDALRYE